MTRVALLVGLLAAPLAPAADGRLDPEPDDLKPGLVAEYRSVADPKATVTRIEPKPAFTLGRSSPHPRIPPGPFEVTWTGVVSIRDPGPITFSTFVGGDVSVTVDAVMVLTGHGTSDASRVTAKEALTREAGYYRLTVRYRSLADVPARLQLWWEGPGFAREPVPAWRLGHLATELSPAARQDVLAEHGQTAAARYGCTRCHSRALPALTDPPPGPSLADAGKRLTRNWLLQWLADPAKVRPAAHMPAVFAADRAGFVERWLIADYLSGGRNPRPGEKPAGDHRLGRQTFLGLGCAACHFVPDVDRAEQEDFHRSSLIGLGDRFSAGDLTAFLLNPHGRYPDGRMPHQPITPEQARDITAYLMLWNKSSDIAGPESPTAKEIQDAARRLAARDARSAATILLRDRGCTSCHTGLGDTRPRDVPVKNPDAGCLGEKGGVRYAFDADSRKALRAYLAVAQKERHPSPFAARQRQLARAGCVQCHQRDSDRPPPIEAAGSKLGGAFLQELPYLRTPRLTNPHQKLTPSYLATTVREGSPGLRGPRFSYRMPAFGPEADALVQALAEADGELIAEADPLAAPAGDPTLGTLHGSRLAGFQGYACASCHVWDGRPLASSDPVATGPDLTRTAGRLRRDWFDRFLENPLRYYPGTPMPSVFPHGRPATLPAVLDGDATKQKDALWAYFAMGKDAPSPKPPPPVPITAPAAGEPILVAQIPIRFPLNLVVESLCLLSARHDLLVYDLETGSPHALLRGGRILRNVQGRIRQFLADGDRLDGVGPTELRIVVNGKPQKPAERTLLGYDRLADGARVRWKLRFPAGSVDVEDTLRLPAGREFVREVRAANLPAGCTLELQTRLPIPRIGPDPNQTLVETPDKAGRARVTMKVGLPPFPVPPGLDLWDLAPPPVTDLVEGSLVRPGYRAIAYPRPKTVSGEDRIMPGAVAVRPKDGQVFVASMKTGELFTLRDPSGDGKNAHFVNYARGLFQDALSMLAEDDGLYVLHRRNLTKIIDTDGDGVADRFDRVAALPHGVADTYDMAYGLARDRAGRFVFGYAPYANTSMPGSGGALRLQPGKPPEEVAYGMRNPLGWCAGPDGEVFFTDNQGDWVATNKLCHVTEGRYFGWPNQAQKQHTTRPMGKTTVWVPYGWARSINGVAYDSTGGKFGPFAGQFFMAELMFGGAIIRANVEKVNGVYQGACFPFWGKGLLGPLTLAFDPRGKLYVGGITEPGWMAQPDRGALFRIDYTGEVPFEVQSIHVLPRGFRLVFTAPVDRRTASDPAAYRLEHHRYEYTGAYGSPELDRTAVKVERAAVSADGRSVDLTTAPLVKDRVYMITAAGVRSTKGEPPVHPTGAYTLNEVPADGR
jgi:mono/diheme cytochrome c family protein